MAAPPRLGGVRLLAVDGPSGAGKSEFADRVVTELRKAGAAVVLISTDHFATWTDPVGWWPRVESGVLEPLRRGSPGGYRMLDWSGGSPRAGEWRAVEVPDVLVIEGVSSARLVVAGRLSFAVWVGGPDAATRLDRAVARDGEQSRAELRRWQQFEQRWFAVDRTAERAGLTTSE